MSDEEQVLQRIVRLEFKSLTIEQRVTLIERFIELRFCETFRDYIIRCSLNGNNSGNSDGGGFFGGGTSHPGGSNGTFRGSGFFRDRGTQPDFHGPQPPGGGGGIADVPSYLRSVLETSHETVESRATAHSDKSESQNHASITTTKEAEIIIEPESTITKSVLTSDHQSELTHPEETAEDPPGQEEGVIDISKQNESVQASDETTTANDENLEESLERDMPVADSNFQTENSATGEEEMEVDHAAEASGSNNASGFPGLPPVEATLSDTNVENSGVSLEEHEDNSSNAMNEEESTTTAVNNFINSQDEESGDINGGDSNEGDDIQSDERPVPPPQPPSPTDKRSTQKRNRRSRKRAGKKSSSSSSASEGENSVIVLSSDDEVETSTKDSVPKNNDVARRVSIRNSKVRFLQYRRDGNTSVFASTSSASNDRARGRGRIVQVMRSQEDRVRIITSKQLSEGVQHTVKGGKSGRFRIIKLTANGETPQTLRLDPSVLSRNLLPQIMKALSSSTSTSSRGSPRQLAAPPSGSRSRRSEANDEEVGEDSDNQDPCVDAESLIPEVVLDEDSGDESVHCSGEVQKSFCSSTTRRSTIIGGTRKPPPLRPCPTVTQGNSTILEDTNVTLTLDSCDEDSRSRVGTPTTEKTTTETVIDTESPESLPPPLIPITDGETEREVSDIQGEQGHDVEMKDSEDEQSQLFGTDQVTNEPRMPILHVALAATSTFEACESGGEANASPQTIRQDTAGPRNDELQNTEVLNFSEDSSDKVVQGETEATAKPCDLNSEKSDDSEKEEEQSRAEPVPSTSKASLSLLSELTFDRKCRRRIRYCLQCEGSFTSLEALEEHCNTAHAEYDMEEEEPSNKKSKGKQRKSVRSTRGKNTMAVDSDTENDEVGISIKRPPSPSPADEAQPAVQLPVEITLPPVKQRLLICPYCGEYVSRNNRFRHLQGTKLKPCSVTKAQLKVEEMNKGKITWAPVPDEYYAQKNGSIGGAGSSKGETSGIKEESSNQHHETPSSLNNQSVNNETESNDKDEEDVENVVLTKSRNSRHYVRISSSRVRKIRGNNGSTKVDEEAASSGSENCVSNSTPKRIRNQEILGEEEMELHTANDTALPTPPSSTYGILTDGVQQLPLASGDTTSMLYEENSNREIFGGGGESLGSDINSSILGDDIFNGEPSTFNQHMDTTEEVDLKSSEEESSVLEGTPPFCERAGRKVLGTSRGDNVPSNGAGGGNVKNPPRHLQKLGACPKCKKIMNRKSIGRHLKEACKAEFLGDGSLSEESEGEADIETEVEEEQGEAETEEEIAPEELLKMVCKYEDCGFIPRSYQEYQSHLDEHPPDSALECSVCQKQYIDDLNLADHMKSHKLIVHHDATMVSYIRSKRLQPKVIVEKLTDVILHPHPAE